jgi:hypothetical protein
MNDDIESRCPEGHRLVSAPPAQGQNLPGTVFCPTCNSYYRKEPDGTFQKVIAPRH